MGLAGLGTAKQRGFGSHKDVYFVRSARRSDARRPTICIGIYGSAPHRFGRITKRISRARDGIVGGILATVQ